MCTQRNGETVRESAAVEDVGPIGGVASKNDTPERVIPDSDPGPESRVPGGPASRQWLTEAGLREMGVTWRPGDSPQSEAAYELIARYFPGFAWEAVNGYDPKRKRVVPEAERVTGYWCSYGSGRRSRHLWLTRQQVEDRSDIVVYLGEEQYICTDLSPEGTPLKTFVKFRGYPVDENGDHYSLADLVRIAWELLAQEVYTFSPAIRRRMSPVIDVASAGVSYVKMLTDGGGASLLHLPRNPEVVQATADWVRAGIQGEAVTLVGPVCPDWSWVIDASGRKRYDFNSVNDGIGIVAERAIPAIVAFARWARAHDIRLDVLIPIGDFEGLNDETLARIGITFPEFQDRCKRSLIAIKERLLSVEPMLIECIDPVLMTELAGGVEAWQELLAEKLMLTGQLGLARALGISEDRVDAIVSARASLFKRWHGSGVDARKVLAMQLPEYGAMGELALRHCAHPLMLGACTRAMHLGFNLGQDRVLPGVSVRGDAY